MDQDSFSIEIAKEQAGKKVTVTEKPRPSYTKAQLREIAYAVDKWRALAAKAKSTLLE